jgi:hypothetical protein
MPVEVMLFAGAETRIEAPGSLNKDPAVYLQ